MYLFETRPVYDTRGKSTKSQIQIDWSFGLLKKI